MTKVINKQSTDGANLPRESKKGEGEKRKSPLTPYREKGKGKESKPVVCSTGLFARVRTHEGRWRKAAVRAAVAEAVSRFNGSPSDERLWANFAWRLGYGTLLDCMARAESEIAQHVRPVAPAERPRILQNILAPIWNRRFPKGGAR